MSFDPSRAIYPHIGCGNLPCTCKFEHKPLEILKFTCNECGKDFRTVNDAAEHHLDRHSSIPLDLSKFNLEEHKNGSL